VVNERDGLGDETPPDYLTSVRDGRILRLALLLLGADGGRPGAAGSAAVAKAITPDYALGGHTASLGLCWLPAGTLRALATAWSSASTARGTAAR